MYYVKAKGLHKDYKTVHLTDEKLYPFDKMQLTPLPIKGESPFEFNVTNDRGVTKWHHASWFEVEIIWQEPITDKTQQNKREGLLK